MTLDEAIKHCEEVAEKMDNVCETGINEFGINISEMYADDTEVIDEVIGRYSKCAGEHRQLAEWLKELKQLREQTGWISVSERLPEDLEPVNITWVNHEPEPYYHDIKDKNFVATGIYYRGQWYWYSTTCADYLGEYGSNEIDEVDSAIEIVAWMPLPEPYKTESEVQDADCN